MFTFTIARRLFATALIGLALTACGGGGDDTPDVSIAKYEAIKLGMTVAQVESIMGGPANVKPPQAVPEIEPFVWDAPPYRLAVSFKLGAATMKSFNGPNGLYLTESNF
jgi:hypothetical protein